MKERFLKPKKGERSRAEGFRNDSVFPAPDPELRHPGEVKEGVRARENEVKGSFRPPRNETKMMILSASIVLVQVQRYNLRRPALFGKPQGRSY